MIDGHRPTEAKDLDPVIGANPGKLIEDLRAKPRRASQSV